MGIPFGFKHSEKTKAKMSAAKKGKPGIKGRKLTAAHRAKISIGMMGNRGRTGQKVPAAELAKRSAALKIARARIPMARKREIGLMAAAAKWKKYRESKQPTRRGST